MRRLYAATRKPKGERCDLCAVELAVRHDHLYDPAARLVRCACKACAMIIPTRAGAALRLVPDRRERVELDGARWLARFGVPVGIAAVLVHDGGRAVVGYPGPAGLVESELEIEAWRELCADVPAAGELLPEVEALVCSTAGGAWRVGIDVLFEMIGELRATWRGFGGGPDDVARAFARVGGAA